MGVLLIGTFVRWGLTAALLVAVFLNAHWSVGLSLSLIAANLELQGLLHWLRYRCVCRPEPR